MEKRENFLIFSIFLLIVLVFSSGIISADYSFGENKTHNIQKTSYSFREKINGWINISFMDEPVDSFLSDGSKSIEVRELLNSSLNSEYNYTCDFDNCEPHFVTRDTGESQKSTNLNKDEFSIFGVKLAGDLTDIENASFYLDSEASSSCNNQIEIDLLADDSVDAINTNKGSEVCGDEGDYGCFDESKNLNEYVFDLSNYNYCQKINITTSTSVEVGASMKNKSGSTNLTMGVYDMNNNPVGKCNLPYPSDTWEELSCTVDGPTDGVFVQEKPYYICVEDASEVNGEYLLRGYYPGPDEEKCGSSSISPFERTQAYQIFAKEIGFGDVSEFKIQENLATKMENYLMEEYGGLDCSSHPCVIPIKINSNVNNQNIIIKNAEIKVDLRGGGTQLIDDIYDIEIVPAKVTSDYGKFYFNDAGFLSPAEIGNFTFELDFNDDEVMSEELRVVQFPQVISLTPTEASTIPTEFEVYTQSAGNITSYSWDFGDNTTTTTTKRTISHTYASTGNYTIEINITDTKGRTGAKSFNITIKEPKEAFENMLNSKKEDMNEFEYKLSSYNLFEKTALQEYVNFEENKKLLEGVDANYTGNNSEELYGKLVDVKLPSNVDQTASGNRMPSYPDPMSTSPAIVSDITGENYSLEKEEAYTSAIDNWALQNTNSDILYNEYTIQFNGNPKSYNFFTLSIKKTSSNSTDDYYFIVEELDNMKFSVEATKVSGTHYYIPASGDQTFSFSTTENIGFEEIPYFISPKLSEVDVNASITDIPSEPEPDKTKWIWYVVVVIGLAVLGLVGYYFLQRWYDKKYEDALFKDKNKLYNLASYVTRAKKKGMSDSKIRKNLKKANWSGEQIRYVMKKYAGKRTGLPKLFGNLFGGNKPKKPGRQPRKRPQRQRR